MKKLPSPCWSRVVADNLLLLPANSPVEPDKWLVAKAEFEDDILLCRCGKVSSKAFLNSNRLLTSCCNSWNYEKKRWLSYLVVHNFSVGLRAQKLLDNFIYVLESKDTSLETFPHLQNRRNVERFPVKHSWIPKGYWLHITTPGIMEKE